MKEEFKQSGWNDFKQRYQGTYGWYEKENGTRMLSFLAAVHETELVFLDEMGCKFKANPDKGNVFTFLPIERGCYNYGETDVIISRRVPQRMWKRGICQDNTYILSLARREAVAVDFPVLREMFIEKPNERLEEFKHSLEGNLVFNKMFALVNYNLYLYENIPGVYISSQ